MVFSWGCNLNHQLGLLSLGEDQPDCVYEPTLVEDLLQYSNVRKIKCTSDQTMVLVDSPNTLLVFSKRDSCKDRNQPYEEDAGEANVRDDSPNFNYRMNMQDQRLGNASFGFG